MKCWIMHDWSLWIPVRAWEYTLEEWRICSRCGKFEKGNSYRIADREAVISVHSEATKRDHQEDRQAVLRLHETNGESHEKW